MNYNRMVRSPRYRRQMLCAGLRLTRRAGQPAYLFKAFQREIRRQRRK